MSDFTDDSLTNSEAPEEVVEILKGEHDEDAIEFADGYEFSVFPKQRTMRFEMHTGFSREENEFPVMAELFREISLARTPSSNTSVELSDEMVLGWKRAAYALKMLNAYEGREQRVRGVIAIREMLSTIGSTTSFSYSLMESVLDSIDEYLEL